MSNARENRIKQLEEQLAELESICARQRDSLAAQQEAIVQLNISLDSTLACIAEKYGEAVELEDGTAANCITISTESYPGVLDRKKVGAVIEDGCYVITVAERKEPEEGQNGTEQ